MLELSLENNANALELLYNFSMKVVENKKGKLIPKLRRRDA